MKILICIESALYLRNFVRSGALSELEQKHELVFLLPKENLLPSAKGVSKELKSLGFQEVYEIDFSEKRNIAWYFLTELFMAKLRHKSRSFQIKFEKQPFMKPRKYYRLLILPGIFEIFLTLYMKRMGNNQEIISIFEKVNPDLILLPTSLIDSLATEVLYTLRSRKTPKLMLINGWDNLSSKGTIPIKPDFMGVWGEQSALHATSIHRMKRERVVSIGAPQFEPYFSDQIEQREIFLKKIGIPPEKKVILFAGSARQFDETQALKQLENAIQQGELSSDCHFIYRPHPWRHPRNEEQDFFEVGFKHVTIDPELEGFYRRSKTEGVDPKPQDILPDLSYYPSLFSCCVGVIQPCSTMLVEAALMGKPSVVIAFGDGRHSFAPDTMIQYEHFKEVLEFEGIVVCNKKEDLILSCQEMLKLATPEVGKKLKEQIRYVVKNDKENPYPTALEALATKIVALVTEQNAKTPRSDQEAENKSPSRQTSRP